MVSKLTQAEAIDFHNLKEFGDFIESLTLDQFIEWVYQVYGVSMEERALIEEGYRDEGEEDSSDRL